MDSMVALEPLAVLALEASKETKETLADLDTLEQMVDLDHKDPLDLRYACVLVFFLVLCIEGARAFIFALSN